MEAWSFAPSIVSSASFGQSWTFGRGPLKLVISSFQTQTSSTDPSLLRENLVGLSFRVEDEMSQLCNYLV